jgi:hypothetical protein
VWRAAGWATLRTSTVPVARLALFCLLVVGCRASSGTAVDLQQADARSADVPSGLSCAETQRCIERCPEAALSTCAPACIARLGRAARPHFDALEACAHPACASRDAGPAPCLSPTSTACKICVMTHCAAVATSCLTH